MKQKKKPDTEIEIDTAGETEDTQPTVEEWETDMPDAPEEEPPRKGLKAFFSKIFYSLVEEVEDEDDEEEEESEEQEIPEEEFPVPETPEEDISAEIIMEEAEKIPEEIQDDVREEIKTIEEIPEESGEILLDAPEDMPDFREEAVPDYQSSEKDIMLLNEEEVLDEGMPQTITQAELSDSLEEFSSGDDEFSETSGENGENSEEDNEDEEDDDEDELNPDGTKKKNFFSIAIPVMVVVVLGLGFAYCLQLGLFSEKEVYYMPDLVGRNYYELGEDYVNFDIQVNQTDYSAYDKDVIYAQDIPAGTEVKLGQTVNIDLSLGYATGIVPDVQNYQFEYAQKLLEQSGFTTEIVYEQSLNGTAQNNVIRTVPASGDEANIGSKITMYVSEGLGAESAQVQDFTGMLLSDALSLCEMYGLEVETVPVPALQAENVVVSQSIEAGTSVPFHTIITLTYSNGEQPKGTVNYQVNFPAYASGRFILDFIDKDGNVVASSDIIVAGFSAGSTVPVEGLGSQEITVVLNNYTTNLQAELGTYHFDFTTGTYEVLTEDMQTAFEAVKGIA